MYKTLCWNIGYVNNLVDNLINLTCQPKSDQNTFDW